MNSLTLLESEIPKAIQEITFRGNVYHQLEIPENTIRTITSSKWADEIAEYFDLAQCEDVELIQFYNTLRVSEFDIYILG